jgi:molybdenum cofactor guanylyltransferase
MGWDKTTLVVDGTNVVARAGELLARVASPAIEVGPGRSRLPVIVEDDPGAGPLAGVAAGWRALGTDADAALVVAGDLPFLSEALLRFLATYEGSSSVVPVVEGRDQPLCARWSRHDLERAVELAATGEGSVRHLAQRRDVTYLEESQWGDVATATTFADIDTAEDLERLGIAADRPTGR